MVLAWWTPVHRHVHLSLIHRRLESAHVFRRNRLHWPVSRGLLTGLHLSRIIVLLTGLHLSRIIILLLSMYLFSRNAEHKTAHCATLIMPHIPKIWLRSNRSFMVMFVRLMSLHWQ
jgi:hypothetical protein